MKNWKKVILGVALSFMVFFTAIGYAALTDNLTISGTLNASAPNDIFITNITTLQGDSVASITGLTSMSTTISGAEGDTIIYAIKVKNNTEYTHVYTGIIVDTGINVWPELSAWAEKDGSEVYYKITDAYVSGIPIEKDKELTFYIKYTLEENLNNKPYSVEFKFEKPVYTITYINNGETLDVRYVYNNESEVSTANSTAQQKALDGMTAEGYNVEFAYWMNAGSSPVPSIPASYPTADYPKEVTLYPKFNDLYTAMFVNQDGRLLDWTFFTFADTSELSQMANDLKDDVPVTEELTFDYWEVHVTDADGNTTTKLSWDAYWAQDPLTESDIAIYPVFKYNGDVQLIPVDNDGNGTTDEYLVGGYNNDTGSELVEIPRRVNGVDVTEINASAFDIYDDLHSVRIPATVTSIGSATFSDGVNADTGRSKRETITLYYEGNPETWEAYMDKLYLREDFNHREAYIDSNSDSSEDLSSKVVGDGFATDWDNNMGDGSRVFFVDVDENGEAYVNPGKGYWELEKQSYGFLNLQSRYIWVFHPTVTSEIMAGYTGICDCDMGEHSRKDAKYWDGVTITATFGMRDETTPENETTAPEEETTAPPEETTAPTEETTASEEKTTTPEEKTTTPEDEATP